MPDVPLPAHKSRGLLKRWSSVEEKVEREKDKNVTDTDLLTLLDLNSHSQILLFFTHIYTKISNTCKSCAALNARGTSPQI